MPVGTRIDITIPVLNEEETLAEQVRKVHAFLTTSLADLGPITITIADNGSTDRTLDIAGELAAELSNVRCLSVGVRGVGRALKASWSDSDADVVGYMDLDLATDLTYLRPALEPLLANDADIVAGSRLARGARVIGRSPLRGLTSRGFNGLVKVLFHTKFSDGMCGFKFLRRECFPRINASGADSDNWFFATEVLVVGEYLGLRVRDLAVEWTDDPNSKVKILKLSSEYLREMVHLRKKLKAQGLSA